MIPAPVRVALLASAALALAGCEARFGAEAATEQGPPSPCEPLMFEESPFTLCTIVRGTHRIRMDLAPPDSDAPYRSLVALSGEIEEPGLVAMAMNGGMFDPDGQPIGYYVEDGRRFTVLNENAGPGNFHLLPNGVFFGAEDGGWQVQETAAFAAAVEERPGFATQSGPMLVIDGELHPRIDPDGSSRKIRNAVGVDARGRALFVISEAPVSFGKLARLYRDLLNVENALFLDGSVSQLWDPANGRLDTGPALGPLIVVENRAQAGS